MCIPSRSASILLSHSSSERFCCARIAFLAVITAAAPERKAPTAASWSHGSTLLGPVNRQDNHANSDDRQCNAFYCKCHPHGSATRTKQTLVVCDLVLLLLMTSPPLELLLVLVFPSIAVQLLVFPDSNSPM